MEAELRDRGSSVAGCLGLRASLMVKRKDLGQQSSQKAFAVNKGPRARVVAKCVHANGNHEVPSLKDVHQECHNLIDISTGSSLW